MRLFRKIRWWWYRKNRAKQDTKIIEEDFISAYWKFEILIENPITLKWDKAHLILNINLNPIERFQQRYVKIDSTPTLITKVILKDGGCFHIKEKPVKLFEKLGWEIFEVN